MEEKMLTTGELAKRWGMTQRTLKGWRKDGKGPKFVNLSNSDKDKPNIRYQLAEVQTYESKRVGGNMPDTQTQLELPDDDARIKATEEYAESYKDDPRDCIQADVMNAFDAGAIWMWERLCEQAKLKEKQ